MIALTNVQSTVASTLSDFLAAGGLGSQKVIKAVTFLNTVTPVPLFTVTGDVVVRLIAVCQTNLTSAGACNIEVGVASDTDALLPTTNVTLIDAGEVWMDAAPDSDIEALATSMQDVVIGNGADILATLSAQVDAGVLTFYCFYIGLSTGATVVAV